MPRILSISYDVTLLKTRAMLLRTRGFEVESAYGFSAAVHACENQRFDLAIIGHSIPPEDKKTIIKLLRSIRDIPILALNRDDEFAVATADYNILSDDPEKFLDYVQEITNQKGRAVS